MLRFDGTGPCCGYGYGGRGSWGRGCCPCCDQSARMSNKDKAEYLRDEAEMLKEELKEVEGELGKLKK